MSTRRLKKVSNEGEAERQIIRRPKFTLPKKKKLHKSVEAHALFAELVDARLFKGVYKDISGGWDNEHLWNAIGNSLPWPLYFPRPSKDQMLYVVKRYEGHYKVNHSLDWVPNDEFRKNLQTVLRDMHERGPIHLNDRGTILLHELSYGSESVNGMIQESWSSGGQQSVNGPQESFCESDLTE